MDTEGVLILKCLTSKWLNNEVVVIVSGLNSEVVLIVSWSYIEVFV